MTHALHGHSRDHAHDHAHDHSDGHSHDHVHMGRWAKVRHAVSDVFGAHSHDAADQVDEALEADVRGRRALWISLGVLALTAGVQVVVVTLIRPGFRSDIFDRIGNDAKEVLLRDA